MKEMKDRYVFLRTAEHNGEIVALIADKEILGEAGATSLRLAHLAHATTISRAGILTYTVEQLKERLPMLEKKKMHNSAAAYKRAIECVESKGGGRAPDSDDPKPHSVETEARQSDPNPLFANSPPTR